MPRHLIQGPDGTKHIIEAPDGATPEQIMDFAEQQFGNGRAVDRQADTRSPRDKAADERVAKERAANRGIVQSVDDVIRNLARGTPIGSWAGEIAAGGNAALHKITGGAFGEPYEEGIAYQNAYDRAVDAESTRLGSLPIIGDVTAGGVTKLTGAIASAPFAPAVRAFGGGSLLANSGNALLTGAGYGALYGAGEGEGTGRRGTNALIGAGVGGTIGAVIPGVAAGARNAYNALSRSAQSLPPQLNALSRGAVSRVSRGVTDDGLTPSAYAQQARELGPEGMLADMGPNLTDQASAIATQPGQGSRTIRTALQNRRQGAAGRVTADVDQALGPARNLVQLEENVIGQARAQAQPHYEQFYQTVVPVTPELQTVLQRVPQRVLTKAQELADLDPNYARYVSQTGEVNGMVYDLIKRASDDLARAAGRGTNEERLFSSLSRDLRNAVDNALSPGQPQASPWAVARSIAGDGMQFREGLEKGGQAFSRGTHPDQMAADLAGMPAVQRMGYNEGARGQIRDIMGNAATTQGENASAAARRALGSENARRKIAMVASQPGNPTTQGPIRTPVNGQARADQLIRRLEAETRFQNTSNEVLANSRTAGRLAAQKEFPNAADTSAASEVGKKSLSGAAMEAAYRVANALVGGALNSRRVAIARDAARMLVAQGMERDQIVQGLRQYQRTQRLTAAGSRAIEALTRTLLEGARQRAVDAQTGP
jgi:hypothetical protein